MDEMRHTMHMLHMRRQNFEINVSEVRKIRVVCRHCVQLLSVMKKEDTE